MLRWLHLFKNYYMGLSFVGIIVFVVQEIPYMVMPLIKLQSNPIMDMHNEAAWITGLQTSVGILTMLMLMLTVKDDEYIFSLTATREKISFFFMTMMIVINFIGWGLYYLGHQISWLIVITQFATVPLYYMFYGLWKNNYLIVGSAAVFFVIHTINGSLNFIVN